MEQPTYYAIIPANVRYDSQLTADEKLLYGEITCLSNAKGYCYASNSYFAELYRVDVRTVQRWLKNLLKCGYINISYDRGSYESCTRKIYINATYVNPSPDTTGIDGETEADPETARAEYVENPKINKSYVKAIFDKWNGYGLPNRGEIEFLNRFGSCHTHLKGISSDDVLKAIDNYASVRARPDSWYAKKHNLTFESFCRCIDKFLDGNFDIVNFCDSATAEEEPQEEPKNYTDCPKCHKKQAERMTNIAPVYYHCHNCNQDSSESDVYDYADCIRFGTTDIKVMRQRRAELQAEIEREEAERKRKEDEENSKWLKRYAEIMEARKGGATAATATETKDDKPKDDKPKDDKPKDDKPKESYEDYLRRLGEEALKKSEGDAQAKAAEE